MPNWIFNKVRVTGTKEDVEAFKQAVSSRTSSFDFEVIVPIAEQENPSTRWGTKWTADRIAPVQHVELTDDIRQARLRILHGVGPRVGSVQGAA